MKGLEDLFERRKSMPGKLANGKIRLAKNQFPQGQCKLEDAKEAVSKLAGVHDVEADHISDSLYVEFDPERISFNEIRKHLYRLHN